MKEIISKYKTIWLFLLKVFVLYVVWVICYELILSSYGEPDKLIITNLTFLSEQLLKLLGYTTFSTNSMLGVAGHYGLGIENTPGLIISNDCNGLDLFVLFSIFIVSFPGKTRHKLVFIPIGLLLIHLCNSIRIVLLAIIEKNNPAVLQFNHSYTFQLIMYIIIFFMWMLWVKKFAEIKQLSNSN